MKLYCQFSAEMFYACVYQRLEKERNKKNCESFQCYVRCVLCDSQYKMYSKYVVKFAQFEVHWPSHHPHHHHHRGTVDGRIIISKSIFIILFFSFKHNNMQSEIFNVEQGEKMNQAAAHDDDYATMKTTEKNTAYCRCVK